MKTLLNRESLDTIPEILPVIPTMDVVVFPHMIVPLLVVDEKIIAGINQALDGNKLIFLVAAKNQLNTFETIDTNDLYSVGTIASIMRVIKIPEGGIKVLVQGICKARAHDIVADEYSLKAATMVIKHAEQENIQLIQRKLHALKTSAERVAGSASFSPDFHLILSKLHDPEKVIDYVLSHLTLSVEQAQTMLEMDSYIELLDALYHYLTKEVEVSELQERIKSNARESMNQAQKEFYLREQLRAIKRELGEDDGQEISEYYETLETLNLKPEIATDIKRQISRLERTAPESMEAAVTRNYLTWVFSLPWNNETTDNLDLEHAKQILNEDHYGLDEIKERILDFISIRTLKKDGTAPILCFVGPPGTGKTSLGKSIARSLGRTYARISLGGVKDEAEIRGHRRTYVGAMPGRFIQAIRKSESMNPLIVIDELDKIGADFRGDPSAAMLEVLDPQQNQTFYDNYLGFPFDLSKIMFIATANTTDSLSEPLKDRLEIIKLSGYTLEEKRAIAKQYLVNKAANNAGLPCVTISDSAIDDIISSYTKESGVRQLERFIKKLCSKAARALVEKKAINEFTQDNLETYLGPHKYIDEQALDKDHIGITNGLAWTPYGGEVIMIEAVLMPGKGKLLLTGQLGSVMKESAQAALSYARTHAKEFGIKEDAFTKYDLHIHVPAGAVPKDGPSAGITMLTSILSALTQRPINSKYAMTGELNLRGEIMPIGGVKEKILAAKRHKLPYVIIPLKNKNDLVNLAEITKNVDVILVQHADEVLKRVLLP
jgi:ATP-dependent Lon protease